MYKEWMVGAADVPSQQRYPLECEVVPNKSLARFATKQKKDFDRYLLHHLFHILIEVPAVHKRHRSSSAIFPVIRLL
jgi:hypothetical protein